MNITINLNGDLHLHLEADDFLNMFEEMEDLTEDECGDEIEETAEDEEISQDEALEFLDTLIGILRNAGVRIADEKGVPNERV